MRVLYRVLALACLCQIYLGCKTTKMADRQLMEKPLFLELSSDSTQIHFANNIEQNDSQNLVDWQNLFLGSGVSAGDINNDGLPDLYFTSNQGSSALYLNKGNMMFEDITNSAGVGTDGWCSGTCMADVNNDGWLDIYVCRTGNFENQSIKKNLLFINQENENFLELGDSFNLDLSSFSHQANFFDFDNDGDLDVFIANYAPMVTSTSATREYADLQPEDRAHNQFLENIDGKYFVDISEKSRVAHFPDPTSLATIVHDFNSDGFMDIYVTNDFSLPDRLFININGERFENRVSEYMKAIPKFSMGVDMADMNNDGLRDLFLTDMLPYGNYNWKKNKLFNSFVESSLWEKYQTRQEVRNCVQIGVEQGRFVEMARMLGVDATGWSWAPLIADFDNDGWKDIFVSNGTAYGLTNQDYQMFGHQSDTEKSGLEIIEEDQFEVQLVDRLFRNLEGIEFKMVSDEWGLTRSSASSGAVYSDLNGDGSLDLVICRAQEPAAIYANQIENKHSTTIKTHGILNKYGIGCKVYVHTTHATLVATNTNVRGYLSSIEPFVRFGISSDSIERIEVVWPSGKVSSILEGFAPEMIIHEIDAKLNSDSLTVTHEKTMYRDVTDQFPRIEYTESLVDDFRKYPSLPMAYSKDGPSICVGDINGDGLDDFIVSSSSVSKVQVYVQNDTGFELREHALDLEIESVENGQIVLFDSDNDGDLDLYLTGAGWQESNFSEEFYSDALYINNGKGFFEKNKSLLPEGVYQPTTTVVVEDLNKDGYSDLILGAGYRVGEYPLSYPCRVLINDQGSFNDESSSYFVEPPIYGGVKSMVMGDLNSNGMVDLVIASHWNPIHVLELKGGKFLDITRELGFEKYSGLWNSLLMQDIDNDGDMDLLAGNWGVNSELQTQRGKSVILDYGDFDKNGRSEVLMSRYFGDTLSISLPKSELLKVIPSIVNEHYRNFSTYAKATRETFLQTCAVPVSTFQINEVRHGIFRNVNGHLEFEPLPLKSQVAPIFGMDAWDMDGDNLVDLAYIGNSSDMSPLYGKVDASNGGVLLSNGASGALSYKHSGLYVPFEGKALTRIRVQDKLVYIAGFNGSGLRFFQFTGNLTWEQNADDTFHGYFSQRSTWRPTCQDVR